MHHAPSPAAAVAAALAARAEEVCLRYLPNGRRLGRYWVCGDLDGARGRSLFVRLCGSAKPGRWTDAATGDHGDLLDLIRYRTNAPTLRAALDEARAFLALPAMRATASGATQAAAGPASPRPSALDRLISAAVSVRAEGKGVGHPAGVGADGEGEVVGSLEKGERGRDRERFPTRSSTHRHQPG